MKIDLLNKLVFRTPANRYKQKDTVDTAAIREALYLASPVLTQELDKYDKGQIKDEKEKKKLRESAYKYYSRSCTRCTPFGLFAGVGTCKWGDRTDVQLADTKRRETRLDMNYVCALGQYIASLKEIRDHLLFYPNNSIYPIADKIRYVDYKFIKTRRSHQISEVDRSEYLDKILELAQKGILLKDLANAIVDDEVKIEEATEYVYEIVNEQLLKSELEPNVTGDYYFDILLRKLAQLKQTHLKENKELENIINILNEIDRQVKELDKKFTNSVDAYKQIMELIKQLPVKFEENNIFQTDLYLKTDAATLNKNIQTELIKTLNYLTKLNTNPKETNLTKFAEEYYKRYEDAELPLLYVLDTELGIGYANNKGGDNNPLVEGLAFGQRQSSSSFNYTKIDSILHKKLKEAFRNKEYNVTFTDEDFKDVPIPGGKDLPATFPISFSLPAGDEQILLNFSGGVCAANILGRFAGGDKEVLTITREIIEHENKFFNDKIIAEIVHLPESRIGNILMRPAFREYEIPYLANAFVADDKVIPLSDLFISIRGGNQVVVRSKKLNKEILPRLTNAHNFSSNALPIYQFLCDLQSQGLKSYFSFGWGAFSGQYKFKPRATYGKVVLKEATWDMRKEDLKEVADKGFDKENIKQFLDKWQMPEIVLLADSDNTLLVEWYNELSFNAFISSIKNRDSFTLTEHIFSESAVKDKKGNFYENEFLAFVINNDLPAQNTLEKSINGGKDIQRSFAIGSEWLYYKLYTGAKTADRILINHIKLITDELLAEGLIDKWFFIRYSDPEKHLRIRFHIPDSENYGKVIHTISKSINSLLDEKLIWKIQADTYAREIERYGALTIEECENYFWHDSVFVTEVINLIEGDEGEKIRWIAGFRAVDELLDSFGFNLEDKKTFMDRLADGFRKENGDGKGLRVALDKKFRDLKKEIEPNLNREKDSENDLKDIWNLLAIRTQQAQASVKKINELKESNQLNAEKYNTLITSLIHMLLNRLFKSQQRTHELVIYDLLFQYYKSMIARNKGKREKVPEENKPSKAGL